jgi:chromate transporter
MPPSDPPLPQPSQTPLRFFLIWLLIGVQSFGGGTASFALIQRTAVDRYHWLTEADFVRDWALVQLAPGVNLLGLIVLIGRRWGGAPGIALALCGLLLPSAGVTILMAALYVHIAHQPAVQAALRGVLPATVGLGLISAYGMLRPLMRQGHSEGRAALILTVGLVAACALIAALWSHLPVVFILLGGGAIFATFRATTVHPTAPETRTDIESAVPETVADALTREETIA